MDNSQLLEIEGEREKLVFLHLLEGPVRVVELSKKLGMDDGTVGRILKHLVRYGVAIQRDDKSYVSWNWPLPEKIEQAIRALRNSFQPVTPADVAVRAG